MESMSIYIAMHKPYQTPSESCYIPIQVGASAHPPFTQVRDDQGEHISEKNPSFCELTALYWIWKNTDADLVGLAHYRRHFARPGGGKNPWERILTEAEIRTALEGVDLLLPKKRHYVIETNYSQYAHAHYEKDLIETRYLLWEMHPKQVPVYDDVMNRRSGHRFNMMIARREVLDRYCAWLFPILFELEKQIDTTGYSPYDQRVFGFLAERLLDVWLETENIAYREVPVVNLEGEKWISKGFRFCMRKLRGYQ